MAELDGGSRRRDVIDQALDLEQLTFRRRFMTGVVALLAIPVWLLAIWPRALPAGDRRFVLWSFGVLGLVAAGLVVREWRAGLALARRLAEHPDGAGGPAQRKPPPARPAPSRDSTPLA